jgi:hypothetical protein
LPETGNHPQAPSATSETARQGRIDKAIQQMYMMLEDCRYTADRAEAAQKQALEVANYAHSLSVGMKKLLAELQKDLDRPRLQPMSDRSQMRPELVTAPEDEH